VAMNSEAASRFTMPSMVAPPRPPVLKISD
jgi:hypothetical protein